VDREVGVLADVTSKPARTLDLAGTGERRRTLLGLQFAPNRMSRIVSIHRTRVGSRDMVR
jgi:hypothetical protein